MALYVIITIIVACVGAYIHGSRDSLWDDTGFNLMMGSVIWPIVIPILFFIWLGSLQRDRYD